MDLCVIIVTYGERAHFVKQVVDSCAGEMVKKIVIVDNGSGEENKRSLSAIAEAYPQTVIILTMDSNTGSAGGFYAAMECAASINGVNFILALDDDNKIASEDINKLACYWQDHVNKHVEDNTALLALREDRLHYMKFIETRNDDVLLGAKNSFMGFHVANYVKKIIGVSNKKKNIAEKIVSPIAPYGGMFFHKSLLKKHGLPKKEMYLYCDDTEFSYRITKAGGEIIIIPDAKIVDLDQSWDSGARKKRFNSPVLETKDDFRVRYSFRNRVYFERNYLVTNKLIYLMNIIIYLSDLAVKAVCHGKLKRVGLVVRAIRDGFRM
ncbi:MULTISPECIES: glycosyltransferase [Serratia]|uniref:glycosyltransferase n=1 Tax=Serratia TaxID=613 RepID=UPI0014616912|nr:MULTISPECIES: glycosyltransferase [Serratia]MBH3188880.1 glycosyltransferase [Serratia marcescens]NMQ37181.1 glycosyltransferase [Serratia marcescens]SMP59573.1 Glycosyltransferase, GT2 family [Serratia sp. CC22-02]HBH6949563.1 glycosyltransferase [Serratia marcescens]